MALLILGFLLFVYGCVYAALARARERPVAVFRHIGLIVRQNLPLVPALRIAARSESYPVRRVLWRTARLVEAGAPLTDALHMAYPGCPAVPLSIMRTAQQMGTLPAAMGEINRTLATRRSSAQSDVSARLAYLSIVMLLYLAALLFLSNYMVPKFTAIFADFGITTPLYVSEVLAALPTATAPPQTFAGKALRGVILALAAIAPILFNWGFLRLLKRRADRARVISWLLDTVQWYVWPFRAVGVSDGCASTLPVLRLAVAAGWPLPDAIQFAANVDANRYWTARMRRWASRTRAGEDPVAAGRAACMPDMLLRHVAIGIRDSDMEPPLRHAEHYYRAVVHRWRAMIAQLIGPLLTLLMALIVGSLGLAIVLSLKELIDHCCRLIL